LRSDRVKKQLYGGVNILALDGVTDAAKKVVVAAKGMAA
jgi:hypothetical protein